MNKKVRLSIFIILVLLSLMSGVSSYAQGDPVIVGSGGPRYRAKATLSADGAPAPRAVEEKIKASTVLIFEQKPGGVPTRSYAAIVAPHVVAWHGHAAITDGSTTGFMLRMWLPNGDELAFDADHLILVKIHDELTLVGFPVNDPLGSTAELGDPGAVGIGDTVTESYYDDACGCIKFQYGEVTELLQDPHSHFYSTDPFDLVQGGDSGGGVFDSNGRLVGVHTGRVRNDPQTNIAAFIYSHEGYAGISRAIYSQLVAATEAASVALTPIPSEPSPKEGLE